MTKLTPILTLLALGTVAVSLAGPNVRLAWDASPDVGVKEYAVYFSTKPITNMVSGMGVVNVTNKLTATVSNLTYSTTYFFRATAKMDGLESDFSNETSYTTPKVPAPSNLSATPAP